MPHVLIAGGENNNVGNYMITDPQEKTLLFKPCDTFWAAPQLDLTVDNELAAAKVNIVASTSGHNVTQYSGTITSEIKSEASLL
jgi:hypothetical protein